MLKDLGLRMPEGKLKAVYERLKNGQSAYQLYAGRDAMSISKVTAYKLQRLYKDKKLDYLKSVPVGVDNTADPDAEERLRVVTWAEALAPEKLFTLKHLRSIGFNDPEACTIMKKYDSLVLDRARSVISKPWFMANERMSSFPRIGQYLQMLYQIYYITNYPDAPRSFLQEAVRILVSGKLASNELSIRIGRWMMRYEGWRGKLYQDAITDSIIMFCKNKPRYARQWNAFITSKQKEFPFMKEGSNG